MYRFGGWKFASPRESFYLGYVATPPRRGAMTKYYKGTKSTDIHIWQGWIKVDTLVDRMEESICLVDWYGKEYNPPVRDNLVIRRFSEEKDRWTLQEVSESAYELMRNLSSPSDFS